MSNLSPLALYIHWPFCKSKCPYCDFNSHVREKVTFIDWKVAMLAELEYVYGLVPDRALKSIFFGGGTPSLMPPDIAEALITRAKKLWNAGDDIEITLEANPTSVEIDTFPNFKQAGVNRLSIGIQSLDAGALKFLGREHSADEAMHAIDLAREHFTRYSFDLIYARPEQSLMAWEDELGRALELAGGHISLYQLTIEENTAFHTAYAKGAFVMPEEELAAQMYELTEKMTAEKGLYAYEVSNYAKLGEESLHNLAYWLGHEYAGVGAGAHGRVLINRSRSAPTGAYMEQGSGLAQSADCVLTRHATMNLKSPERWLEQVQKTGNGLESFTELTPQIVAEERLMMGLRLVRGMVIDDAIRPFVDEKKRQFAIAQGLLVDDDAWLIATPKGRLVLTSLTGLLLRE